jgi:hypothetical protein
VRARVGQRDRPLEHRPRNTELVGGTLERHVRRRLRDPGGQLAHGRVGEIDLDPSRHPSEEEARLCMQAAQDDLDVEALDARQERPQRTERDPHERALPAHVEAEKGRDQGEVPLRHADGVVHGRRREPRHAHRAVARQVTPSPERQGKLLIARGPDRAPDEPLDLVDREEAGLVSEPFRGDLRGP